MCYDLHKEFSKKSSVNFSRRRYKNAKPQITICNNLKPEHIVYLINGGDIKKLAEDLGCINIDVADFHVEHWDSYGWDCDCESTNYSLVATEK